MSDFVPQIVADDSRDWRAIAAVLFAAGMFLKKAFVASFSRGNSSTGK